MFTKYLDVTTVTKMPTGGDLSELEKNKSQARIRFDRIFNRFFPSASSRRLNQNPRPQTHQKDDAFSVSEIRIVFPVKKTVLGSHYYLGATFEVSNDLMVKIKLSLQRDHVHQIFS